MQKRLSISETREDISDIQNDPVVQKLFEDAIEVLRLAGADDKATVEHPRSKICHQATLKQVQRREKKQNEQSIGKQSAKPATVTKSKRRKLERIKAPVTILRKTKQVEVPSEEDQETAVQQMLSYVNQMPSQETFQPPALPFVSIEREETNEYENDNPPNSTESIQDYTYLSNEKDIGLWKTLVASPTNCNIFVGGLGHGVTSEILHAAFEAFSLKDEDKQQIKTHVVMDVTRNQSKGYGFVSFPCRRSAELSMMCMQDFEIYGRAMQLGWGQKNREEQPASTEELDKIKPKGDIVSDTIFSDKVDFVPKQRLKRRSSRWDQVTPKKCQRIEEPVDLNLSQGNPDQKSHEILLSKVKHQTTEQHFSKEEDQNRATILHEKEIDCKLGETRTNSSRSAQNSRKAIQWLTHDQKVALIKSACSNLRASGVRGHLGVFGVHYEADNSRLYVVCAKHVTEAQLYDEFKVFGTADVKLNKDVNGFSKGCAFVQYTESSCAEQAIKQLHGKVVGGMPMKVMVAEPKVHKGSREKKKLV